MSEQGYARPEILAETDWLAAHLADAQVRVIDCRLPEGYATGHIPGAVALPVHHYLKAADGMHILPPEEFAALMRTLGVGDETLVVTYDDDGGRHATRLWWALYYHGHDAAKVLNGGLQKWRAEGRPLTTEQPTITPADRFTVRLRPAAIATREQVQAAIGAPDVRIFDVRSAAEYTGKDPRQNKRSGHIPGAINKEWVQALDTANPYLVWRPAEALRSELAALGITPDKQIITHCQAGIRAAHAFFTLHLLGYDRVANYDASWNEWGNRDDTPIVQGD